MPSYKQCRKVFKELVAAISQSSVYLKSSESYLEIYFKNGSTIAFASAEQGENLRSYTCTGLLLIDEAAYIPDDVYGIILPVTNVHKCPVVMISTPRFRTGMYYEMYMKGWDRDAINVHSYDWANYDTAALLSPERMMFYKKIYPEDKYTREILGQFTDTGTGVFKGYFDTLIPKREPEGKTYIGVDWSSGVGGDETVFSVFDEKKNMVDLIHFNDKDDQETVELLANTIQKYNACKVTVEMNSIGQIYYNILKRKLNEMKINTHLSGFNTSNDSKRKIVEKMQVAIQNSEVHLLDDEALKLQFSVFENKLTAGGKETFAAIDGQHDDIVMATLIAFNSLQTGNYSYL